MWLYNKESFFILTLLILGPHSLGKDMDIFLRPLVDKLKQLWKNWVETRNVIDDSKFKMCTALLWTMNDFPTRSYLSRWSGQGNKTCPTCNKDTPFMLVLTKTIYVVHRHFLPMDHSWRNSKKFNGKK